MAFLFMFNALWFGSPGRVLISDLLSFYLLTLSIIDYRHRIIPDELSLSLVIWGLVFSYKNPFLPGGWPGVIESLLAGTTGFLGMLLLAWLGEKLFKKEALGGGDIKLMAAFGALLGWSGLFGSLFFGSLLGGLLGGGLMLFGRKKRGDVLPFGPFLSFGAYLACLFPNEWIRVISP
jgi:leader peptidase (prepilin peptidase)/N-methyltransferase